jgi:hypothetical protein
MAKKEAEKDTKPAVVITPVFVDIHPNWQGKVIESRKYAKVSETERVRYDCRVAVPGTDEEAKTYFNCTIADLIEAGARQKTYEETVTKPLIDDRMKNGLGLEDSQFVSKLAEEFKTALVTEKTKSAGTGVKAQAMQLSAIYAKYGLDPKVHTQADLEKAIIAQAGGKKK